MAQKLTESEKQFRRDQRKFDRIEEKKLQKAENLVRSMNEIIYLEMLKITLDNKLTKLKQQRGF